MSSLETIKRSLRNYLPTSVNIDDFIKAEMTLALLENASLRVTPQRRIFCFIITAFWVR